MLIDNLRLKLNEARKAKKKEDVSILSFIIGEVSANAKMVNNEKVVEDSDMNSFLKKYLKNLKVLRSYQSTDKLQYEIEFVENLLPNQLTEEEIRKIYEDGNFSNIGTFMKHLKEKYNGMFDGKLASKIARGNNNE